MIRHGDVVIARIRYTDAPQAKSRPAIVVQNDRDNARLRKTIVVVITGTLTRANDPSHFVIDPATPEGASAGIRSRSVVSCNNIFTIEQSEILQVVGHLSDVLKKELNVRLKAALQIP